MSTAEQPWQPAVVAELPDPAAPKVRIGAAEGNVIEMPIALALIELWHDRAAANVGTALAAPDVFELLMPLFTPEVLSAILTAWRGRNAALFGSYLGEAFTGITPTGRRERRS